MRFCAGQDFILAPVAVGSRSIGVISLIGNAQANRIYTRLITELGAEVIENHRIMCGNAATFQGQERDIVFLSMGRTWDSRSWSSQERLWATLLGIVGVLVIAVVFGGHDVDQIPFRNPDFDR